MPQNNNQNQFIAGSTIRQGGTLFYIEVLEPGTTTSLPENRLTLPAFISSIQDSFSPSWGQYQDMGRADSKTMYEQFNRTISISFKVLAYKRDRNDENSVESVMNRLNTLTKAVTPAYPSGVGFVGRYIKFTLGKLLVNEYGLVESYNFGITSEYPWQVDSDGQGERPIVADVDISIKFIGDKRPDSMNPNYRNYSDLPSDIINIATLIENNGG